MAFLNEITELYRANGLRPRLHPRLRGGKHSDLAVKYGGAWIYFEVKTRHNAVVPIHERRRDGLLDLQREIRRAARHAIEQLPAKRSSMIVVRTSPIRAERKPLFYRSITRQALASFFAGVPRSLSAVVVLMPIRSGKLRTHQTRRFLVTLVSNPKHGDDAPRRTFHQILSRYFGSTLLSNRPQTRLGPLERPARLEWQGRLLG